MEDDAQGETLPRPQSTDAVAKIDAIGAARPLDRSMANSEDHRVPLREGHDFHPRLHARSLLGENEFPSAEILAGSRQKDGDLQRKDVIAVGS